MKEKIAEINMMHVGSTGKIMFGIAGCLRKNGYEVYTCSPRVFAKHGKFEYPSIEGHKFFGCGLENAVSIILSKLTGLQSCFAYFGTIQLIHYLKKIKPDVIHLHNIHNRAINIKILFNYIKRYNIKTVWTLHDCWAFTGHCPHFALLKCDKWKSGCYSCKYPHNNYPQTYADGSQIMWKLKKKWFTGIENMTLVTPSLWLAGLVRQSYLKDYPVETINNGIDLAVFRPTESDFREKYGIADKYMVLGVAYGWGESKGLDVFIELAERLDDRYQIVLVGTTEENDRLLPENIISIHRTYNQQELTEIYTASDIFVNPTREDNYPTVNMEALACGTPVISFNTGGSAEIFDESCGIAITCDDVDALEKAIKASCEKHLFSQEACLKRAENFDSNDRFQEYAELFRRITGDN